MKALKKVKLSDFSLSAYELEVKSKMVRGGESGHETEGSELEYSDPWKDLDCSNYGDWYPNC